MAQRVQHAVITGGSSGIGKAAARLLAQRGAHLTLIARNEARLEQARRELDGARAHTDQHIATVAADVSERSAAERASHAALAQHGPPDLLLASAGMTGPGYAAAQPVELFEQMMATNYFGTLYVLKALLPAMRARRRGHIALVSSGAGLMGIYGYAAYGASKFALRGLAEALRAELKPEGIRVSIIYPPDTDTPMLADESQSKPAATQAIAGSGGLLSADAVARAMVRGIERGAFVIAPGAQMTLLARLHSLLLPLLNWHFDRIIRRVGHAPPPDDEAP
jgi:3-dehydrosphinganine reductase